MTSVQIKTWVFSELSQKRSWKKSGEKSREGEVRLIEAKVQKLLVVETYKKRVLAEYEKD